MSDSRRMQCMEVWGGNGPADTYLALSGLDAWVYCKPYGKSDSGGDVYYLSSCATGRISRILLADVSGHGQNVAATATQLRRIVQQYVNYLDQDRFIQTMNRRFTELQESEHFATAIVVSFFATNNHISMNIAGHPAPLLYRADARSWSLLTPTHTTAEDMPLGLEVDTSYSQFEVDLGDHDFLLAYTDALIEALDANGEPLGLEGLLALVSQLPPLPPEQIVPRILELIDKLQPGNLEADDVTAVLLRPTNELKHLSFGRMLMAPIRFVGRTIRSLCCRDPIAWPQWSKATVGGLFSDAIGRRWKR